MASEIAQDHWRKALPIPMVNKLSFAPSWRARLAEGSRSVRRPAVPRNPPIFMSPSDNIFPREQQSLCRIRREKHGSKM
jgi:hypothetical protein